MLDCATTWAGVLDRLQFGVNVSSEFPVSVDPNRDVNLVICGDSRQSFNGVALERIQETYYVPVYLMLAALGLSARLLPTLLKRHSYRILFPKMKNGRQGTLIPWRPLRRFPNPSEDTACESQHTPD